MRDLEKEVLHDKLYNPTLHQLCLTFLGRLTQPLTMCPKIGSHNHKTKQQGSLFNKD